MKLIETNEIYIGKDDYKPEWLGNLIRDKDGIFHFVFANPNIGDEDDKYVIWKEELPKVVGEQMALLVLGLDLLEEKIEKRPHLTDEVLKVIYNEKTAEDIIKLVTEGIC